MFTSAGTFLYKWGSFGSLRGPSGVAADRVGDVFVADTFNDQIEKYSVDTAKAKVVVYKVKGPGTVRKDKKATYKVTILNASLVDATGVMLKVSGRGFSSSVSVGKLPSLQDKTVKIKIRPKKPGKVKASFRVTAKNGGGATVKKKIKVKK